jgi:hypothetical protein
VGIATNTDFHLALQLLLETLRQAPTEESVMSEEMEERLRALGYLQ